MKRSGANLLNTVSRCGWIEKGRPRLGFKDIVRSTTSNSATSASSDTSPPQASFLSARSISEHLIFDRNHLWHPYTSLSQHSPPTPVLPVKSASGCTLELETGRSLLDGMSSWWSTIHGYNHPKLNEALENQMKNMSHVMFGGLTHRPAVELASMLIDITPDGLDKVFFADSGSVAVEVALKMALQYHRGMGSPNKTKFVSLRSGYHGDTFGAMSVCDPVTGMHSAFSSNLMQNIFVSRPPCDPATRLLLDQRSGNKCNECSCAEIGYEESLEEAIDEMEKVLSERQDEIAAFILEPIVQGAGGMRFYERRYLKKVEEACRRHNVLFICDEIATGFGRAGDSLFASDGLKPDILCLGKALTGGTMTMGITMATEAVAEGVSSPDNQGVALPLMHGPTFMANPLACAVSLASVSMVLDGVPPMWKSNVSRIEEVLREQLSSASGLGTVADVRVKGAIGVIEMKEPIDVPIVMQKCLEFGVWLRPFGRLLYTMPPYIMTPKELSKVTNSMEWIASATESECSTRR